MDVDNPVENRLSFGQWLRQQKGRDGLIGQLATGALADRTFPRDGSPGDLRARLRASMADGDMYEAVDDAEMDWLSY